MRKRELGTQSRSLESSQVISPLEQWMRVRRFTLPAVEVDEMVRLVEDSVAIPVPEDQRTAPLIEAARIRADSQNEDGLRTGYYPQGVIVDGAYTYSKDPEAKARRSRYKPNLLLPLETIWEAAFPQSKRLRGLSKRIERKDEEVQDGSSNNRYSWKEAENWSSIANRFFSDPLVTGYKRISSHLGWPVVVFTSAEDLRKFQPYPSYQAPENALAISFVAHHRMTPKPGEILENSPYVACVEGCSADILEQHIRTQLVFAQAYEPKDASPILLSTSPGDLEAHLVSTMKERILDVYLREKEGIPSDWATGQTVKQQIALAQRELFQKLRHSTVQSPFYIEDRPDRLRVGYDYKTKINDGVAEVMLEAFTTLDQIASLSGARVLQFVKANFFSFFPIEKWQDAAQKLLSWDGLQDFRESYRLPALRSLHQL